MVVLGAADLDALPPPTKRTIDVLGFVPDDDVDPILARHGAVGVCEVALRSRVTSAVPVTDREPRLAEVLMDEPAAVDLAELRDDHAAALEQPAASILEASQTESG